MEHSLEKKKIYTAMENSKEKKRHTGLDLLRIVAMLMIITLHYMDKGGMLADWKGSVSGGQYIYWIIESASLCSVNAYILISGYFASSFHFSLRKLVLFWLQVAFYSVGIAIVFYIIAYFNGTKVFFDQWMNLFNLQFLCFPIVNGHYWFASAFFALYILQPVLNTAVLRLDKKTHGIVVLLLLTVCCLTKSVIFFELAIDDRGYGIVWFVVLYLLASYIGFYGIPLIKKKIQAVFWYVLSVAGIVVSYPLLRALSEGVILAEGKPAVRLGDLEYAVTVPLSYNYIFVLTASISFFMFFSLLDIKNRILVKIISFTAPLVFGVYLIHEHLFMRYTWQKWFGVSSEENLPNALLRWLLVVPVIFITGIFIDWIRSRIFKAGEKLFDICYKIYLSKKEVFDYLVTGGLTTAINWIAYILCAYVLLNKVVPDETVREWIANAIAWVAAVIFAYVTNRIFIFHSDKTGFGPIMKEFGAFVSARVISFVIEQILFVGALYIMDDIVAKLLIGIIVVILNYVFSKLWIFKKNPEEKKDVQ